MKNGDTIFSLFLESLGVTHTPEYSDDRFRNMTFKSLFGFSRLLKEYGIDNEACQIADKLEIDRLDTPFMAQGNQKFVIVTSVTPDSVTYLTETGPVVSTRDNFFRRWNGVILMAYPDENSVEPDYVAHRRAMIIDTAKKWILIASAAIIALYLFISNSLYADWSDVALLMTNGAGLYVSYLLMLKTLNIKSRSADRACGFIETHGCDHVLSSAMSSFMGIFKWSEVGLAYFSVSLMTLLVFPEYTNYLAFLNLFCLPYSFWSVWYQKTRAKAWCTLCLSVQALLWLSFFCYLGGGHIRDIFPLRPAVFILGLSYLTALLAINRLSPYFSNNDEDN